MSLKLKGEQDFSQQDKGQCDIKFSQIAISFFIYTHTNITMDKMRSTTHTSGVYMMTLSSESFSKWESFKETCVHVRVYVYIQA